MSYPGNPSLAQDVQERISNTFQQTLDLVTGQRDQEALVGCEFILRMDPEFQPAKTLVSRLKSGARPVMVDDLRTPPAAGIPTPAAPPVSMDDSGLEDLADLEDLAPLDDLEDLEDLDDLDLGGDLSSTSAPPLAPAPPSRPVTHEAHPAAGSGLAVMISDLLARRNFEQILQIAETQKQAIESEPEVAALVEKAQGLLESDTYVQAFLKSARQAQAVGQLDEMESYLKKARSLDPEHPEILEFSASAAPTAAPVSSASEDGLLALQQQSLSLESDEETPTAGELAANMARDPRKTKPMTAVTPEESQVPVVEDSAPLQESFDAELLDDEATDAAVGSLDAELFDLDGKADELSDDGGLEALGEELFDEPPGTLETSSASGEPSPAASPVFQDEVPLSVEDEAPLAFDDETPLSLEDDLSMESLQEEDFSTDLTLDDQGSIESEETPADGDQRVGELITEGQEAFDRGEYQAAIDVWSRIFLIDIDNAEASSLIEEARSKKAELERQAEELFHEAVGHLESESLDEAKSALAKVLELAPSHSLAREYLEQLESGKVPVTSGADLDISSLDDGDLDLDADSGSDPGKSSMEAAVARDRVVVVKRTDRKLIALGAAVLLAILGTGAFLMLKWDDLFPNQEPPPTMSQQARKVDPIERATKMHEGDNTENAILLLERIQPQDPIYEDAQALIAQWKALVEAPPEPEETGPSEEQAQRYGLLVSAAREAHQQGRLLRARSYFERASKILPLDAEDQALLTDSSFKLESLADEIKLFDQRQYAAVIPALWRKREKTPDNLDIQRLLVDAYYNLALTDLQRGNAQAAAKKLREAQEVQPDNQELQRLQLFAQTYTQRRQDLLYRIFVKYLPSR